MTRRTLRAQSRKDDRYWRTKRALRIERVHRAFIRRGLDFTDEDWRQVDHFERLENWSDHLRMRLHWLNFGGRLEVRGGRLELSETLHKRSAVQAA